MSQVYQVAGKVLEVLKKVLETDRESVPLHEPWFCGNEWTYLKDCLDSTFVSSVGKYVERFEVMLTEYTGVKRAVATVNGTSALHAVLKLAGVNSGDEVLLPALTFVATANAVSYLGASPHFIESEGKTLGVDPDKLRDYMKEIGEIRRDGCYNRRTGRRIPAIVAVHTLGHPVDLDPLLETCDLFHVTLIEDASESLGSLYKGKHTGHWGKLSVLSFNGNKILTTGGGGAILTNDEKLGDTAKHITTTAKVPHRWNFYHDQVGFNYRMPNINAALGCAQIEQLPSFLGRKRELAERYAEAFSKISGVKFFTEPPFAKSNYWLNAILVEEGFGTRDAVLETTNGDGIQTRPVWTLMHKLPMYRNCPRMDLSVAEYLEARIINIPSSAKE